MKVIQKGMSGTMESSDIHILIEPNEGKGIEINLSSPVIKQFGPQIRAVILQTLELMNIEDVVVTANDKGALDYAIIARVEAAAHRGAGKFVDYEWGGSLA